MAERRRVRCCRLLPVGQPGCGPTKKFAEFIDWLKLHNEHSEIKTGFYGIDIYSLWESMDEVVHYLTHTNPAGADLELAKKAFSCFEPFNREPEGYAISQRTSPPFAWTKCQNCWPPFAQTKSTTGTSKKTD
nr:erythromycin esterase family protein [Planococcus glaciei]